MKDTPDEAGHHRESEHKELRQTRVTEPHSSNLKHPYAAELPESHPSRIHVPYPAENEDGRSPGVHTTGYACTKSNFLR